MKLYVIDENGSVVFEFSDTSGGLRLNGSVETKVKLIRLLRAAIKFLMQG
jgi:hypothetical protein